MFTQAITEIGRQKAIGEAIKLYEEEMDKVSFNSPRRSWVEFMHSPGVGVRTKLKFLEQVLHLIYYLSFFHQTCMGGPSGPIYELKDLDVESEP